MAPVLGKRKVRSSRLEREGDESQQEDVSATQDVFRRFFEAQFTPLEQTTTPTIAAPSDRRKTLVEPDEVDDELEEDFSEGGEDMDEDDAEDEESDLDEWDGISEEEDVVEVVDHSASNTPRQAATMTKKELKAYMSSRPPSSTDPSSSSKKAPTATADDTATAGPEDSAALLANDLALQRLIAESHILAADGGNPTTNLASAVALGDEGLSPDEPRFASGRARRRTTDLRLQALGAKHSILPHRKMSMAHRKATVVNATAREERRRREARESGIVLERPTELKGEAMRVGKKAKARTAAADREKRRRAVDAPAVGKLRGSQLTLSRRDIRDIQGADGRGGDGSSRGRGGSSRGRGGSSRGGGGSDRGKKRKRR